MSNGNAHIESLEDDFGIPRREWVTLGVRMMVVSFWLTTASTLVSLLAAFALLAMRTAIA